MRNGKLPIENGKKNKKILFDDDGEAQVSSKKHFKKEKTVSKRLRDDEVGGSYKDRKQPKRHQIDECNKIWYLVYSQYNKNAELIELKETELTAFNETCKSSFETEHPHQLKKNPPDAKWLETALLKGTAKDRVNAGALLVHSNPVANLLSLDMLICLCKVSNRTGPEVLTVLSELFIEALLPTDRKLFQLSLRGADWKELKKREDISKEVRSKIYAYWYFESQLKDLYFEFLKNLQNCIQSGQDSTKNTAIVCASKLLCQAPEKEQMLLAMLINKLGDPSNKIAAKALHHLSEVTFKHPNMCGVITNETEKLLFRNNISERAQQFALCFLAQIAPRGHPEVCTKLVNICFAFFKVLVQKGSVNNKTMQAILRCLQKAIVDAKPAAGTSEIMTKEMQDTVYRLIHLADIRIAIQTLSLLLQLVAVNTEKSDRFYNALYKKLLDLNLTTMGAKTAAQFLHIVHRAIHIDTNVSRSLAFIKRLLQISLYMPSHVTCGCLIVINKIMKSRPELQTSQETSGADQFTVTNIDLSKFDSDGEEKYDDVIVLSEDENCVTKEKKQSVIASWHHAKIGNVTGNCDAQQKKVKDIAATQYDAYHRVPTFAGAEFAVKGELNLLREHFHPTCKVFAQTVVTEKLIAYYGDPLRDFSLSCFLERFAFKNPKKLKEDAPKSIIGSVYNKTYIPHGGRAQPVKSLTKTNCTEDEIFIFNYLEKKRERQILKNEDDTVHEVDDNEFEAYLDGLCKKTTVPTDEDENDFDIDFLKEIGGDFKFDDATSKRKKKVSKAMEEDDDSDIGMDDWGDGGGEDDESNVDEIERDEEMGTDDEGSISLDEAAMPSDNDDSEDDDVNDFLGSDGDHKEPTSKKSGKFGTARSFTKALKGSNDLRSLFAAAENFSELLEESSKDKRHGTSRAISNTDKSSDKQLKWEEKRKQSTMDRHFKDNKLKKFGKKGKK